MQGYHIQIAYLERDGGRRRKILNHQKSQTISVCLGKSAVHGLKMELRIAL